MELLRRLSNFYSEINPATLSGAIDVVVVRGPDGELRCSPFHVRFGKLTLMRPQERVVTLRVNGETVSPKMKVGKAGECFFVEEAEESEDELSDNAIASPISRSPTASMERESSVKKSLSDSTPGQVMAEAEIEKWDWGKVPVSDYQEGHATAEQAAAAARGRRPRHVSEPTLEVTSTSPSSESRPIPVRQSRANLNVGSAPAFSLPASPRSPKHMSDWFNDDTIDFDDVHDRPRSAESVDVELSSTPVKDLDSITRRQDEGSDGDVESEDEEVRMVTSGDFSLRAADDRSPTSTPMGSMERPSVRLSTCGAINEPNLAERFEQSLVTFDDFAEDPRGLIESDDLVVEIDNKFYTWKVAAPLVLSFLCFHRQLPPSSISKLVDKPKSRWWWFGSSANTSVVEAGRQGRPRSGSASDSSSSAGPSIHERHHRLKMKKALKLSSQQLARLGLREGANLCEFTVISKLQGKATISCNIYLWNWDTQIVVSDIDGTITKSDVLGHAAQLVGTDWTHTGVAKLFHAIHQNGYRFLYLSSRSISQSGLTKGYLKNLRQETFQLPDGPMLLSPASLFQSLHREVVLRKPEEFKIACLSDILSLFSGTDNQTPFTAGFGNRITDIVTYRAVHVPSSRIFIIDPKGQIKVHCSAVRSSYHALNDIVDEVFPPTRELVETPLGFQDVSFWSLSNDSVANLQLSEEEAALLSAT